MRPITALMMPMVGLYPHGLEHPGRVLVALLLDVDVRLQQAADILDGDAIHNHGKPLAGEGIGLGLGLVFQRQQALLAGELGPRLQALGLLRKIQLRRKQHPGCLPQGTEQVPAGSLQDHRPQVPRRR